MVSPHTPHSAAIPAQGSDLKRAIVDSSCELYFGSGAFRHTFWLGVPAVKRPLDMWIYQEIINEVRPDVIIETGTAHGGSALFLACICDLVGNGRVVTIDTEASEARPHHPRLTYLTGSSTSGEVVAEVSRLIGDGDRVMVVLDSDHSRDHVMAELAIYSRLVTEGSYLIVEDSVIGHPVFPELSPGPMEAVEEFLSEANEFVADRSREKFHLTFNPRGYLKRTGKLAP